MTEDLKKSNDKGKGKRNQARKDAPDKAAEDATEGPLKPAKPKIGESADNLKQREEWFQKRTGRK